MQVGGAEGRRLCLAYPPPTAPPLVGQTDAAVEERFEEWYGDLEVRSSDRISEAVRRFLYSRTYTFICLVLVVVNVSLLLWEIFSVIKRGFPDSDLFVALEIIINATLLSEITLRAIAMRKMKRFFSYWGNIFDCVVLCLSLFGMIIYFSEDSLFKDIEEGFTLVLLACRYCLALLRVVILVRNQGNSIEANSQRIDLTLADRSVSEDDNRNSFPTTSFPDNSWEEKEEHEHEHDDSSRLAGHGRFF